MSKNSKKIASYDTFSISQWCHNFQFLLYPLCFFQRDVEKLQRELLEARAELPKLKPEGPEGFMMAGIGEDESNRGF